jgi:hypothetical protein
VIKQLHIDKPQGFLDFEGSCSSFECFFFDIKAVDACRAGEV